MGGTGLLGLWTFGLHGRGVEIASPTPLKKRVLIV